MKKVLLFFILINLSLFAQSYINSLYDAIGENNTKKIIDIANNYKIDLNNIFKNFDSVFGSGYETMPINMTPLIYAIHCGNIEAIDTLIKFGTNVRLLTYIYSLYDNGFETEDLEDLMDKTNRISITPLMYAAYSDSTGKVVSFLINKGAKVNAKNSSGKTALMYSVSEYSGLSSTKILISAGADINIKDNEGRTPLMYAAYYHDNKDSKEIVDLILKNKPNVNTRDKYGRTALMYACMYSSFGIYDILNPDIVKSLIKAGAKVSEVDNDGNTALSYAYDTYQDNISFSDMTKEDEEMLPTLETIKLLINSEEKDYKTKNFDISYIAGKYSCYDNGIESDIEIKFIGNNLFTVEGFAVNWQGNMGEFNLVGNYYNNKIICKDNRYFLEINIIDKNSFYVKDNAGDTAYFGMNVGFDGKYKRVN